MHHQITTLFLALLLIGKATAQDALPHVSSGTIQRIENFPSKFVTARNVDVWLPEGYNPEKKYSVLYMHDGQMLFDSTLSWNRTSWDVDDVIAKLLHDKRIEPVIVVGIWNGGATRHPDYFPQRPFESMTQSEKDTVINELMRSKWTTTPLKPVSDGYLQFLVKELKPYIDKHYPTYADRKNTFVTGSSMGGLISMYAICEYPDVFGGAACMSTHWPGTFTVQNNPIPDAFVRYMKANLPNPKTHKIYFDCGDQSLDALYPPLQKKVDEVMREKGFTEKNWITKSFPGADHSEKAWRKRLDVPLVFLFGNKN